MSNNEPNEEDKKKPTMSSGIGSGEGSRCASPNLTGYPMSVRQQLALIKQMEQPSPSSSVDGEGGSVATTPGSSRKRVSRVHKKNDRGETPLHVAARKGDEIQCERLIEEGAEVNCADYAGWSPLHEASFHNRFHAAQILIEKGANVNFESMDRDTPLHDAASKGFVKIVWLLLKHGADKSKTNKDGKQPIDLVDDEDHPRVYSLLTSDTLPAECPSGVPNSPSDSQGRGGGYDSGRDTPGAIPSAVPPSLPLPITIPIPSISLSTPSETETLITQPQAVSISEESSSIPPSSSSVLEPSPSSVVPIEQQQQQQQQQQPLVPSLPPEVPISVDTTDPLLSIETQAEECRGNAEPLLTKSEIPPPPISAESLKMSPTVSNEQSTSLDISIQNVANFGATKAAEAEVIQTVKQEIIPSQKPSSQPATPTLRIKFSLSSAADEQQLKSSDSAPTSIKGSPGEKEKATTDAGTGEGKEPQTTQIKAVKALSATVNISPIPLTLDEQRRNSGGGQSELFESGPLKVAKLTNEEEEETAAVGGATAEQRQATADEGEIYDDDEMSKDSISLTGGSLTAGTAHSSGRLMKKELEEADEGVTVEEWLEERGEATKRQRLGVPRGRGMRGRPSRSNTPMSGISLAAAEKSMARKTVGRGRGSKRGRGNANYGSRLVDTSAYNSAVTDDVFEFRGSPDPDNLDEDEILARPPSTKRSKMEKETESVAGSYIGDADDMNEETGDEERARKVPPLRISLPKTPSEEDPEEPRRTRMGIRTGKGNGGGIGTGVGRAALDGTASSHSDDAQRITRSKVRRVKQCGKGLEDLETGLLVKKRRRDKGESDFTRESSVLPTIEESESISMIKMEVKEEVAAGTGEEEVSRVGQEILAQNPNRGAIFMKRMLANRWLYDLENQQNPPEVAEEKRFDKFLLFTGDYRLKKNGTKIDNLTQSENKPVISPARNINSSMTRLYKKQKTARRELRERMLAERIRLRLVFEGDLVRISRRRNGSTPLMSFCRMHAESQICNPLFLDESSNNNDSSFNDLALKKQKAKLLVEIHKRSSALYRRHKMEAEALNILQRNVWNVEASNGNISLTERVVKQCVPRVRVRKIVLKRPRLQLLHRRQNTTAT